MTLKHLLSKTRLIPRLIASLREDPKSSIRGHLILIANVVRLSAEEQHPTDYIPQLLESYPEWKEFAQELMYAEAMFYL